MQVDHLRSGVRDQFGQDSETPSLPKNTTISWARWYTSVVPATQEAEVGGALEPRKQRLRWTQIMLLHSSLGDGARLHLKKTEPKQTKTRQKNRDSMNVGEGKEKQDHLYIGWWEFKMEEPLWTAVDNFFIIIISKVLQIKTISYMQL